MREVRVTPVTSEAERMAMLTFPWEVYRDDPHWVPPLLSERKEFTDPEHNPFFEHARVQYFLARRGDRIVGTIGVFSNDLYNQFHETNVGWFGFFEVIEDREAAAALLDTAADWARHAGHTSLLGPAQFSTNDEIGLLVDGFDDPPRILMTYNPPYYVDLIEAAGFRKAHDLLAYRTDLGRFARPETIPAKAVRVVRKVRANSGLSLRRLNMRQYDRELEGVEKIYNQSWARNWGFVPMTGPEIRRLGAQLKTIIDPDLVSIVEHEGQMVAFGLALPDLSEPLRLAYPDPRTPEWLTLARFLWEWKVRRRVHWLRFFALGVLPEFRGRGADALMYLFTLEAGLRKGYRELEASWVLEDNDMMNRAIRLFGATVYKTYRVYEKPL